MSSGKLNIPNHLKDHSYPRLFLQWPRLIHLLYFWNRLILQRTWVTRWALKRELDKIKNGALVDAGCGEGMFILPYAKKFRHINFTGWDKNEAHLFFCENYSRKKGLKNTHFEKRDLTIVPQKTKADILLCIGTLQYIENDELVLSNFYKKLKQNGTAIIYIPLNGKTILPFYRYYFNNKSHYEKEQNRKRVYPEKEILKKIKNAGFTIFEKKYTYGNLGIIGHEIYSLFLIAIGNSGFFSWIFIILLFLFLPFILFLIYLDLFIKKNKGNGILLVLKK